MRLTTIKVYGREQAAILTRGRAVLLADVNRWTGASWETTLMGLIRAGQLKGLAARYGSSAGTDELAAMPSLDAASVNYAPLYRDPERIFGIGLNYVDHAGDLGEAAPQGFPGSFYKPASSIIGPGDEIKIPALPEAQKTTAEAELGVVIARDCRDVAESDWLDVVAGFTTILDMTEESILRQNPRFLTLVKGFDTFFSFGPEFITPDEMPDVMKIEVQSVRNGEVYAKNVVSNMTFTPARLVSLVSRIQGWKAGDILSTGTPRAFHIQHGDTAECRIFGPEGFSMAPLVNPVIDLKKI